MQSAVQPARLFTELLHESCAARRGAEQPDVRDCFVLGERGEIGLIRQQVMTHYDRRVVVRGSQLASQFRRRIQRDALCARKALGNRVRRAMIEHRHVPVHQSCDFRQRHRVRAGAEYEQARRQFDRRNEERRADCLHSRSGAQARGRVQHVGDACR